MKISLMLSFSSYVKWRCGASWFKALPVSAYSSTHTYILSYGTIRDYFSVVLEILENNFKFTKIEIATA